MDEERFPCIFSRRTGVLPETVMVFGERNSGTNHVAALLAQNIPIFADSPGDRPGQRGYPYGWKHAFPNMVAAPSTTLAIGMFRDPETWVRSMHSRPWHAVPTLRKLPFADFLRTEWVTRVDETNFGPDRDDPRFGQELQWDRHPLTGRRFANICRLRVAKNKGFLSLTRRFANCLLIRHEDVAANPKALLRLVSETYGVMAQSEFCPVLSRRARSGEGQFRPRVHTPLSAEDREFLWSQLDPRQEAGLGYSPHSSSGTKERSK